MLRLVSWKTTARPRRSVPATQDGLPTSAATWRTLMPLFAAPRRLSTFSTPRLWSCAPTERKTAPTSAIGMPSAWYGVNVTWAVRSPRSALTVTR
jgi:hypothetical protein